MVATSPFEIARRIAMRWEVRSAIPTSWDGTWDVRRRWAARWVPPMVVILRTSSSLLLLPLPTRARNPYPPLWKDRRRHCYSFVSKISDFVSIPTRLSLPCRRRPMLTLRRAWRIATCCCCCCRCCCLVLFPPVCIILEHVLFAFHEVGDLVLPILPRVDRFAGHPICIPWWCVCVCVCESFFCSLSLPRTVFRYERQRCTVCFFAALCK